MGIIRCLGGGLCTCEGICKTDGQSGSAKRIRLCGRLPAWKMDLEPAVRVRRICREETGARENPPPGGDRHALEREKGETFRKLAGKKIKRNKLRKIGRIIRKILKKNCRFAAFGLRSVMQEKYPCDLYQGIAGAVFYRSDGMAEPAFFEVKSTEKNNYFLISISQKSENFSGGNA